MDSIQKYSSTGEVTVSLAAKWRSLIGRGKVKSETEILARNYMIYAALNVTNNSTVYYKFSRYSPLADSDITENMSTLVIRKRFIFIVGFFILFFRQLDFWSWKWKFIADLYTKPKVLFADHAIALFDVSVNDFKLFEFNFTQSAALTLSSR